jgi:hypothetical protein
VGACRRDESRQLDELAPTITNVANEVVTALPHGASVSAEEVQGRLDEAPALDEQRREELERRWAEILEDGWSGSTAPPTAELVETEPPAAEPVADEDGVAVAPIEEPLPFTTEPPGPSEEELQIDALQDEAARLRERLRRVEADLTSLSERTATLERQNRALIIASNKRRNQVQLLRMFLGLRTMQPR